VRGSDTEISVLPSLKDGQPPSKRAKRALTDTWRASKLLQRTAGSFAATETENTALSPTASKALGGVSKFEAPHDERLRDATKPRDRSGEGHTVYDPRGAASVNGLPARERGATHVRRVGPPLGAGNQPGRSNAGSSWWK
jgi:hypothetical protein